MLLLLKENDNSLWQVTSYLANSGTKRSKVISDGAPKRLGGPQ